MTLDGVNLFIDDSKEPAGIVILRFRGQADISGLDKLAANLDGGGCICLGIGDRGSVFMDWLLLRVLNNTS